MGDKPETDRPTKPQPAKDAAFDDIARNLRQRWYADGLGDLGEKWEDRPPMAHVWYLADFAGAYNVSFERFAEAAKPLLGMAPGQGFTADHDWFVTHAYYNRREQYDYRHRMDRVVAQLQALKARMDFVEPTNYSEIGSSGFFLAQA